MESSPIHKNNFMANITIARSDKVAVADAAADFTRTSAPNAAISTLSALKTSLERVELLKCHSMMPNKAILTRLCGPTMAMPTKPPFDRPLLQLNRSG